MDFKGVFIYCFLSVFVTPFVTLFVRPIGILTENKMYNYLIYCILIFCFSWFYISMCTICFLFKFVNG